MAKLVFTRPQTAVDKSINSQLAQREPFKLEDLLKRRTGVIFVRIDRSPGFGSRTEAILLLQNREKKKTVAKDAYYSTPARRPVLVLCLCHVLGRRSVAHWQMKRH